MPLTLEQVKKAGRFAYSHEIPWCSVQWDEGAIRFLTFDGEASMTPDAEKNYTPISGWYHLPGCDCEFCAGTKADA